MSQTDLTAFPILGTERFELRPITPADCNEIFQLLSDPVVNKYYGRPRVKSLNGALRYIETVTQAINKKELYYWGICFKNETNIVGTVCLWNFRREESRVEIGYELLPDFQGKGLMKEVMNAVIDFGFTVLNFDKIDAWPNIENHPSIKILENNHFKRDFEAEKKIDWSKEADFYRNNEEQKIVTTTIYTLTKTER